MLVPIATSDSPMTVFFYHRYFLGVHGSGYGYPA